MKRGDAEFETLCQIALSMVDGIGPMLAKKMIQSVGSAEAIFKMRKNGLQKIQGIGVLTAEKISAFKDFDLAEKELEICQQNKINILSFFGDEYPFRLKHAEDAPLLLYCRGNCEAGQRKVIAIVGTRKSTSYGKAFSDELLAILSSYHVQVISGLAAGTDTNVHRACLKNNIQTLAVLGHGLSTIYPNANRGLAREMLDSGGALLSEYRFHTPGNRENFPQRNRLVAALSDAVIVVESGIRGGSLITADLANQYNRDVYALPGKIGDHFSQGCNRLVANNQSSIIDSIDNLIVNLGFHQNKLKKAIKLPDLFKPEEIAVFELLKSADMGIDELMYRTGLTVSKITVTLMDMEFSGHVRCLPGKIYSLT